MYAVILGLIVVDAMGKFQEARQTTERESNALADIILLSNQLPPEQRTRVQTLALAYVDRVLEDEWPILDHGQFAPSARHAAIDLIDASAASIRRPTRSKRSTPPRSRRSASSGTVGGPGSTPPRTAFPRWSGSS